MTAHRWTVEVELDETHDEAVEVARQLERVARRLRKRTGPPPDPAGSLLVVVVPPLDRETDWPTRVACHVEDLDR